MRFIRKMATSGAFGAALMSAGLGGNTVGNHVFHAADDVAQLAGLRFQLAASSNGGGAGSSSSTTAPFTITGIVANASGKGDPMLAPGVTGLSLVLTVQNANKYAITVQSLSAAPSGTPFFTATSKPSGCPQTAVVITNPAAGSLSIKVAANGTATYRIPIGLQGGNIPNSCQGNTFPLALSGDAVKS